MWSSSSPQEVLCRVDVGGCIWLLVRFSGDVKRWESFPDVSAMTTYLERGSQTLLCPAKCLLPEQAQRLVTDAKRRISKLENEVTRYKALLDKALEGPALGDRSKPVLPPQSPVLLGSQGFANKVTTGSSSSTRNTTASSTNGPSMEAKLGNYATGLQNKFVNKITGVKRRAGTLSSSGSEAGGSSTREPSPVLQRSASSGSICTVSVPSSRQSSAQQLKALLREQRAALPVPSSLDPYLTDGSTEAAKTTQASAEKAAQAASSPKTGTGTAVGTPQSRPRLFPSDDEGSYWEESDGGSVAYERHRDLESGMSTDDGGYHSECSSGRSRDPSPLLGRVEITTRSAAAPDKRCPDQDVPKEDLTSASAGAVVGIALKEDSRDSATASVPSSRLPRRSQSFESVGSNSNSSARTRTRSSKASAAASSTSSSTADFPPERAVPLEEDTSMSLRLSQDEDESRSMLFSHLRDDATGDAYRSTLGGSSEGTITSGISNLFGMVMSVAGFWGSASTAPAKAAQATAPAARDRAAAELETAHNETISACDLRMSDDEDTLMEADNYSPGAVANDPEQAPSKSTFATSSSSGATTTQPAHHAQKAQQVLDELSLLKPSWEKVSAAHREQLREFEKTIRKAKLPRVLENCLLRCLMSKEDSPLDAAMNLGRAIRALQQSPVKAAVQAKRTSSGMGKTAKLAWSANVDASALIDDCSAVLKKLYQRNKKITVADALTVQTICAACMVHITLLLHVHAVQAPARATGATLAETVAQALDRLVLMLGSPFLTADDVPWLLRYQQAPPGTVLQEPEGVQHIECFVHILSASFSGTAMWPLVREAVLRYDYTYQRHLISPIKERREPQRTADSRILKGMAAPADRQAGAEVPLFDVLTAPSQPTSAPAAVKKKNDSKSMPPPAVPSKQSRNSSAKAADKTIASGKESASHQSLIAELLLMTGKRKAGVAVENAQTAAAADGARDPAVKAGGVEDMAPPAKKRNALLSDKPVHVGHRTSMGVGKRVVISAKTLAATAANSAAVAASASAAAEASKKVSGILRSSGSSSITGSSRGAFDDHFTKTPLKSITFSPGTPMSSSASDYLTFTHGSVSAASARRYRDNAVVESTPMEMLMPRRAPTSAAPYPAHHLADNIAYMSSPSPERSGQRRMRAPSTGGSRSSSSSGDSASKATGESHKNRLSSLFNTQDDAEEGGESDDHAAGASLLARSRGACGQYPQSRRSFLGDENFHFLPPSEGADPDETTGLR